MFPHNVVNPREYWLDYCMSDPIPTFQPKSNEELIGESEANHRKTLENPVLNRDLNAARDNADTAYGYQFNRTVNS